MGMSGGVDSSTLAALLVEAGALVSGVSMRIYRPRTGDDGLPGNTCFGPGEVDNIAASRKLCDSLGIPYMDIDLSEEYERLVLQYFREEYTHGRTPNPCIRCNQAIKFGFLVERARQRGLDFDVFATGHYARIEKRNGVPMIRRAADGAKDQSYFLYRLAPAVLSGIAFPLGDASKEQIRAQARRLGLAVADKAESQDFVAGGYRTLFDESTPGDIVDETGTVIGRHRGLQHYTIGQRRGVGVSTGPEALYVSAIDGANNRIVVSHNSALFCDQVSGTDAVIHDPTLTETVFEGFVRIRQNHKPARASVLVRDGVATIDFAEPQRAAAPGQSAVFYSDDGYVLGGCIIEGGENRHGKNSVDGGESTSG